MWFLMRCAFWLSIVYGSIFWSHGAFSWTDGSNVADIARVGAKTFVASVASGAAGLCARHADECMADAARLTSLFHAADPEGEPHLGKTAVAAEPEQVAEALVPLPIPDPRRRLRDAKLPRIP